MRTYGKVKIAFWEDEKITKLGDSSKLLALYLLTGEHSNAIGCYRLPLGYIQTDLRWEKEKVQSCLNELCEIGFLIHDEITETIYIVNYLKHNPIENSKVGKMCVNLINSASRSSKIFPKLYEALIPLQNRFEIREKSFWDDNWNKIYLSFTKNQSSDTVSNTVSNSLSETISDTPSDSLSYTPSYNLSLNSYKTEASFTFPQQSDTLSDSLSDTVSQDKNFFTPQSLNQNQNLNQKKIKNKKDLEEVSHENNSEIYNRSLAKPKKRAGSEDISEALASCIDKRGTD